MIQEKNNEYWKVRQLQQILEYAQWRRFNEVINKAMIACENSGIEITEHFAEVGKPIKQEKNELVTNCNALKLKAQDGKERLTDVTDIEVMFRIIESIPSKNAEPIKLWLARLGESVVVQDNALKYQYTEESRQIENK